MHVVTDWIESTGGPLVLVAASACAEWTGVGPSTVERGTTDYARSCAVDDEIGVLSLGKVQALVIGDEPDSTALLPAEGALFVLRWKWAPSEEALVSALVGALEHLPFEECGSFRTEPGRHVLFDSACPGAHPDAMIGVDLGAAEYVLGTASFQPSPDIGVLIHRLRPVGA